MGTLILAPAACGKRGDPLPPLRPVPMPVSELFVAQRGDHLHLEWMAPSRNQDGSLNVDLEKVEILRRIIEIPPPPAPPPPLAPTGTTQPGLEVTGAGQEEKTPPADQATDTEKEGVGQPGETQETEADQEQQKEESAQGVQPAAETGEEEIEEESTEGEQEEEQEAPEGEEQSESAPSTLLMQTPAAPAPFPAGARVIATLESQELGEQLLFDDSWDPSMAGMRVEYGVRHFNRKGRASTRPSFVAQIEPQPPFAPPEEVTAEVREGVVMLKWVPPPEPVEPESSEVEAEGAPEVGEPDSAELAVEPEVTEPQRVEREHTYAFNVFRKRSADRFYSRKPINAEPVEGSSFNDRRVVFGESWCYVVRRVAVPVPEEPVWIQDDSLVTEGIQQARDLLSQVPGSLPTGADTGAAPPAPSQTTAVPTPPGTPPLPGAPVAQGLAQAILAPPPLTAPIESADSQAVCLTPQDTFAPATPDDVFAVTSSEGILLSWREVDAPDLRGYLVYRAERREGPFERMTPKPVRLGSFTDRSVEPGVEYFYRVSAVDREDPPNESPHSTPVSARAPEP